MDAANSLHWGSRWVEVATLIVTAVTAGIFVGVLVWRFRATRAARLAAEAATKAADAAREQAVATES
jgi:hypothetical protein